MNEVREMSLTPEYVANLVKQHAWAATGVSDYPPRDPLVGQSKFFRRYKTFIHTVDQESDNFAHVFAVEGEWGRGKSRLGHELVAQINDCSKGWYVRGSDGQLDQAVLFDSEEKRDQYLGLYIRYSQVASDYQNSDNWFGFGLYKALLPLATKAFDSSIQSEIARQALRRLEPMGFEPERLKELLELDRQHSDETLYYDPSLVTGLVQAAYDYFKTFGIQYLLVVLDELETVAETATFGLELDDSKRLDGQAIRLIGKAIKEEDPRRKLPWLRYVALCSPLLGQQLREIQSTARRFELVELEHNAFADVSDYVGQLKADKKLKFDYPTGLVEAAYAMSGANFGWFNVVMANVDAVLDQYVHAGKAAPPVGELFDAVLESSGRVAEHVLDHHAIEGIKTNDQALLAVARKLLFGQLPILLESAESGTTELLNHENEDSELVASLYRRVHWDALDCRRALEEAKFQRNKDEWFYPSVEQGLSLSALLQNLRTFAINEPDKDALLIPLAKDEFKHLVGLLYDHPAAEFAADALWQKLVGEERQLPDDEATHIGPSVAMLLRLDLRYRSQQQNSMIFRDPGYADAHEKAMKQFESACGGDTSLRLRTRLVGLFRLLDKHWQYAEEPYAKGDKLVIQMAPRGQGRGQQGGLMFCDGLKLHPNNQAWFAWVANTQELTDLHKLVTGLRRDGGRIPVMAFTGSVGVMDEYAKGSVKDVLKDDILLYHLNSSELDVLERIGLLPAYCRGFELKDEAFTTKFKARLNSIRDFAYSAIHRWRQRLDRRGLIAWPLRPSGKLSQQDRELLFNAWKLFAIEQPTLGGLHALAPEHGLDAEELSGLFSRLTVSNRVIAQGYDKNEQAGLFLDLDQPAQAQARMPAFLARIANPGKLRTWTPDQAKEEWYWGHLWSSSGLAAKSVFDDWMWWCESLYLLKLEDASARSPRWTPLPRAELENDLQEAENWLNGSNADGYGETIKTLERVYGEDRIRHLFAPPGSATQGTHTVEAVEHLAAGRNLFAALKTREEALTDKGGDDLERALNALPEILSGRSRVRHLVAKVKWAELPDNNIENYKTVQLEDANVSLYERVERARLFAEHVDRCGNRIAAQVGVLITHIVDDPKAQPPFPRKLFTLSLETIRNILTGALQRTTDSATQVAEAGAGSDTLLHYLRALRLDRVLDRLELLGQEVGYDIYSDTTKSPSDVDGYIMQAFRQFKERFETVVEHTRDIDRRIRTAMDQLDPLPADYSEANHPADLLAYQQNQKLIEDSFEDLDEKVDEVRSQLIQQARKGQFASLRDVPERLVKPIQQQSNTLGGKLRAIENTIQGYRNDKLEKANSGLRVRLNPLFKVSGEPVIPVLSVADVSGLSLHDLNVEIDLRQENWRKTADRILGTTGIGLSRWEEIAAELLDGKQPTLSPAEQGELVAKGILKVQVTFGGAV